MKHFSERINVGTSASVQIFACPIKDLQAVEIYAVGALEYGTPAVAIGSGIPLAAGESDTITHLDFRKDDRSIQNDMLILHAIASVATTVHVSGWRRS